MSIGNLLHIRSFVSSGRVKCQGRTTREICHFLWPSVFGPGRHCPQATVGLPRNREAEGTEGLDGRPVRGRAGLDANQLEPEGEDADQLAPPRPAMRHSAGPNGIPD